MADEQAIPTWDGSSDEGAAEEAAYFPVNYFGETIRIIADPLSLELALEEFMDMAAQLEEDSPRAIGAVRTFIRTLMHEGDFPKWWRLVRENRQDMRAQMAFGRWLVEEVSGHPFGEPSDSESGRAATDQNSGRVRSWQEESLEVQHEQERAGRPDLASIVLVARESREAREAAPSRA